MNNQQAINLLKGLEQSLDDYCELNDEGKTAFRMAITALELFGNSEQLPSVQPDIIRCEDCKWYGRADKRRFYRGMDCLQKRIDTIVPDRDFCSKAERRTDDRSD